MADIHVGNRHRILYRNDGFWFRLSDISQVCPMSYRSQTPDEMRTCEFCGCKTNARQRFCCGKGRDADRKEPPPLSSKKRTFSLWSFLRDVLHQGEAIGIDARERTYEWYSARMDEAARQREEQLRTALGLTDETKVEYARCPCGQYEVGVSVKSAQKASDEFGPNEFWQCPMCKRGVPREMTACPECGPVIAL